MWNLNQLISGGDEEMQDNLLGDIEGLCSLSPLQINYGFTAYLLAGLVLTFLVIYGFAACLLAGLVLMFLA